MSLHPPAYFQDAAPIGVPLGTQWVDSSSGPPYQAFILTVLPNTWDAVGGTGGGATRGCIELCAIPDARLLRAKEGIAHFFVPAAYNGAALTAAHAGVTTPSTSGEVQVRIWNATDSVWMLQVPITIDEDEYTSYTAATPPVVNPLYATVQTADRLRVDVDTEGVGTKGLYIMLEFE